MVGGKKRFQNFLGNLMLESFLDMDQSRINICTINTSSRVTSRPYVHENNRFELFMKCSSQTEIYEPFMNSSWNNNDPFIHGY